MYILECIRDDGLVQILEEGWRILWEEEPPGIAPDLAAETGKRQIVNELLQVNYGERDPYTGHLAADCYPYDEPGALLSLSELKQKRLLWSLRPAQAPFWGGMLILVRDDRVQVRLPLHLAAVDDPQFWRRVWACLRVIAEAKLHVYDIQLERTLDLQRDQEIVRQTYSEVVIELFVDEEEEDSECGFLADSE